MVDQSKRQTLTAAIAAGAGGVLCTSGRQAFAQTFEIPSLDATTAFLSTKINVELLIYHLNFAVSAAVNIILIKKSISPSKSGEYHEKRDQWTTELKELYDVPDQFFGESGNNNLATAVSRMMTEDYKTRWNEISLRLELLVSNLSSEMISNGIDPNAPISANSIQSLHHLERIAVAMNTDDDDSNDPWICRRFPFSYFCQ